MYLHAIHTCAFKFNIYYLCRKQSWLIETAESSYYRITIFLVTTKVLRFILSDLIHIRYLPANICHQVYIKIDGVLTTWGGHVVGRMDVIGVGWKRILRGTKDAFLVYNPLNPSKIV